MLVVTRTAVAVGGATVGAAGDRAEVVVLAGWTIAGLGAAQSRQRGAGHEAPGSETPLQGAEKGSPGQVG